MFVVVLTIKQQVVSVEAALIAAITRIKAGEAIDPGAIDVVGDGIDPCLEHIGAAQRNVEGDSVAWIDGG